MAQRLQSVCVVLAESCRLEFTVSVVRQDLRLLAVLKSLQF